MKFFLLITTLMNCPPLLAGRSHLPLISEWALSPDDPTVQLPLVKGYRYDFKVDWGDGTTSFIDSYNDVDALHVYNDLKSPSLVKITIQGTLEAWSYRDCLSCKRNKIRSILGLGDVGLVNLSGAFYKCRKLIYFEGGNTANVTDTSEMFAYASKVNPRIGEWDTSRVKNMRRMFYRASKANPDVSRWNTSQVVNMEGVFESARGARPDVGDWNTSKVKTMRKMFYGAYNADPDVSRWDTSKVESTEMMFEGALRANPDVSDWNTSNLKNMRRMFFHTYNANPDVSGWDFSQLTEIGKKHTGVSFSVFNPL